MLGNRVEPIRGLLMSTKEQTKAGRELSVFDEFCTRSAVDVDRSSIQCQRPPKPDIACTVAGTATEFELVEITDESLAANVARSIKTGEVTGGAFSQHEPLIHAFASKQRKTYERAGSLQLLAYYDKQYPWSYADPTFIDEVVGEIARGMVSSGTWSHLWVYDTWKHQLLWQYP